MTVLVAGAEGTVHYSSDNTGVATVDSNGTVTGVGEGTTMVTVTATETDNYNEAVQIVTISVRLKSAVDNNEDAGSEDSSRDTGSEDNSGDTGSEDAGGSDDTEDSSSSADTILVRRGNRFYFSNTLTAQHLYNGVF
ncbi:MAG: Ig-like domain-containing protein [Lachnospiraceae bacterium]|nr:Ig-like domain-containing protein [Lachnospiraceae bacterium]